MRKLFVVLIGLVIGIGLGLFIGWGLIPINYTETSPAVLRQDWKDEAVWMAAQAFAYDHDLEAATNRLSPLGSNDVGRLVLDRAERAIDQQLAAPQIASLARLAAALGARSARVDPYLTP
jgi:hypothetical protein